jgi:hypothetical protein
MASKASSVYSRVGSSSLETSLPANPPANPSEGRGPSQWKQVPVTSEGHDQAERSLDRVWVTPVKIPMPSMMTQAIST